MNNLPLMLFDVKILKNAVKLYQTRFKRSKNRNIKKTFKLTFLSTCIDSEVVSKVDYS